MLKTIPHSVWPVALVLAALKLALLIGLDPGLEWNPDERRNGRIADNYLAGRGYVSVYGGSAQPRPDSFHASFPVWVYVAWQRAGLPKHYFTLFVFALTVGAYLLGALYVQRTLAYFGVAPPLAWAGAGLWAVYPSVVYYVGAYFWYENLTLPLLILVLYKLLRLVGGRPLGGMDAVLVVSAVTLSCLLRGYLLVVYGLLFLVWLLLSLRAGVRQRRAALVLSLLTGLVVAAAHLPFLLKNRRLFGAYTLSTQAGFELLQGHNSVTDGRYLYNWDDGPLNQFVRAHITQLDRLNQYQESRARAQLARYWIQTHPAAEVKLWLRKTGLFFSPENFVVQGPPTFYHPINGLVQAAFLLSVGLTIGHFRGLRFRRYDALLLLPVVATWLLCLVFFMGFRWRYFAEPAMLMFPIIVWQRLRATAEKQSALKMGQSRTIV